MNVRGRHGDADSGAALILAIGFVVLVGAIVGGLLTVITSSLGNRATLADIRNRQYAADAGVEFAIAQVRASANPTASPCPSVVRPTLNGVAIRVDCTPLLVPVVVGGRIYTQRNVVFSACVSTGSACAPTSVVVRAQVNFEKVDTAAVSKTTVQSWSVNR